MANLNNLFKQFDNELNVLKTKRQNELSRKICVRKSKLFSVNHKDYIPMFYIQGSYKLKP